MDFETALSKYRHERSMTSADSTVDRYVRHVDNWQTWLTDNRGKQVWDAEYGDLLLFVRELTHEGMAPTTISQRVSAISKFYQDMEKLDKIHTDMPNIPENPYDSFDKEDKKLLRGDTKKQTGLSETTDDKFPYLKPDEVSKLVDNVPSPRIRNELIIRLLFNCGFRRGELAACKVKHIDKEDKSIFIPPRKSDKSRIVSYNEDYIGFQLSQWLDYGGRESMTYADESEYLFPTNNSIHISGDYINQMVKKTAEKADLQETLNEYADGREIHKVTAHTLRHSFAMQSIKSDIHVKTLQTLLGHDELDTTLIYLQQSKDEAKEESRLFNPEA
ncbi:tyrosine-type recombinase/integrase [Haloarchaeobius sp. FL176]|uniref:tyrosine-type recombinase/integrase n=1 Tax=Haloarchaeobius sp. FL176 TaxID=2967129 RepID=UPI002147D036|nr:tyrosine-type recombinase/integrase [Haloarchaeobius sp. FL176]